MSGFRGVWWLVFFLLATPLCHGEENFSVAVVVHPGVVIDALPRKELRAIFAMRHRIWPDGSPIHVFVLEDDHPFHRAFCKKVLHIYPHQLRRIWDRNVFSGTGQAPTEVADLEEMLDRIARTEGAIGYLEQERVDASVKPVEVQ